MKESTRPAAQHSNWQPALQSEHQLHLNFAPEPKFRKSPPSPRSSTEHPTRAHPSTPMWMMMVGS
ncbi:hypothetical protein PGTUg99_003742 [Puccinia graminis f. sp. tritici]|uniref:Uncharacterized protein n=1 Tax=Puccinia graminis f. sp. tritici TaxID=56615 RepID=A0A5B0NAN2_PUCGR|nr:hypothetical protein PGTUg99_003742 [Puccinia graminis f. sp. tritici]